MHSDFPVTLHIRENYVLSRRFEGKVQFLHTYTRGSPMLETALSLSREKGK